MTLITPLLMGASFLGGLWDSSGSPVKNLNSADVIRVRPICNPVSQRQRIVWKRGHRTKVYMVECPSGEVYLQWSPLRVSPHYAKTLIRR